MKILGSLVQILLTATTSIGAPVQNENHLDYNLQVSEISDDVFVVTDNDFYSSNVLVVKLRDESVVIVSSPFENLGTKALMSWVKKALRPKK